jgi:prepilin peptidase CpaA
VFGQIELFHYGILVISITAIITDLIWGKIFNWFTLPTALSGLVLSSYFLGWSGGLQSTLGLAAGFIFYGWMFGLRILGGGDVKLLMALGAWGGFRYTEEVALLGLILGGLFSLGLLIVSGKIVGFSRRMYHFLLSVFVKELELQFPKVDKTLTMPFGIPISIAAMWIAIASPLEGWGIHLWP